MTTMSHFPTALALVFALVFSPVSAIAAADAKAPVEEAGYITVADAEDAISSHDDSAEAAEDSNSVEHAEGTEEDAEGGGLPQLDVATYPSQIFWLLLSFAILYVAFAKKILPGIGSVVEARDSMIKGNLGEAEALRQDADNIRASYEKNLETARLNAMKAIQDVENAAKAKAAEQTETFRKKTDERVKDAEARVEVQKDKAMGDMKQVAAEVASIAAEKITGINTDVQKAKAIVDSIADKKAA